MQNVKTTVIPGHRIASGTSPTDRRFPEGSIRRQAPHFKKQGLDLDAYFAGHFTYGTLNLSFAPRIYDILEPGYFMRAIKWADALSAENFYLDPCEVEFRGRRYRGLIYIPDPATKRDHFNPPSMVDVIAAPVPGIRYGDEAALYYNPAAIKLRMP